MALGKCKGCDAEIVWRYTENGKAMPLDLRPIATYAKGAYVLEEDGDHCHPAQPLLDAGKHMHMAHFATCPKADQFKGGR